AAGLVTLSLCDPPEKPWGIEARLAPTGIQIWWTSPAGSGQPVQIYRVSKGADPSERPWKTLPAGSRTYLDESAPSGEDLEYEARLGRAHDPNRRQSGSAGPPAAPPGGPLPP